MMSQWPPSWMPECVVDAQLARTLIERQFPELAPARCALLGEGFDNTAYLVNDCYVFRFPRRQFAVQFLEAEMRVLPWLVSRLPVPIPRLEFFGRASASYGWPFLGYRALPGRTACQAALDATQRAVLAEPLARALAALHALPAEEAGRSGVGQDPIGKLNPCAIQRPRAGNTRGLGWPRLDRRRPAVDGGVGGTGELRARADVVVHGDLYARHVLVDERGALAGIIDWGDACLGDPAVDLAIVHTLLPQPARGAFRAAYGPIAAQTWQMARLRGLWHTTMALDYAVAQGDDALARECQTALAHLAAD